eukprot:TRINITY_DN11603_c0_g1_i1.p1 TRINITY_DN11603_c0_g1~~TRINITY_DN11603_c0_g1_i1.p1  ORF type:complete len:103 (-),score=18.54 TRINITY_DN11603_c0_g1_i1:286-594(-)
MCSYDCLYISSAAILYMYNYQSAILLCIFFFLMIRRPPRSTLSSSSAASDVYKRQSLYQAAIQHKHPALPSLSWRPLVLHNWRSCRVLSTLQVMAYVSPCNI